jgi:hypothetical protein
MKKLMLLIFVFLIFGCASLRNTQKKQISDTDKSKKHILPPNTASNKYSAKRQKANNK